MKKVWVAAILGMTAAFCMTGCGKSSGGDLASGGIKSSFPAATEASVGSDTTESKSDNGESSGSNLQVGNQVFQTWIKNQKTEDLTDLRVGTKIHYLMGKDDSPELGMDISTMVGSGEITDEFSVKFGDAEIRARAINVFGFPVELDQCFICSLKITDASGDYSVANDLICGTSTYDEVLGYYSDHNLHTVSADALIYKDSDDEITYGTQISPEDGNSTEAVFASTREVDGIFKFDNGVLSSISLEAPELLYYEMRRNVNQYELEQMNADELNEIEKKRNEFLGEIKKAFAASSVDVSIDDSTGTISMNSDILFDTDSYDVKDSAKEYIDEFFKVYTSVLMRDDVKSSIKSVKFEGHTDTQGDYDYNMTLSQNRAKSVMDYCINDSVLSDSIKDMLGSFSEAVGYSYQYPVYAEDGQVDMDASRRVEINFVIKTDYVSEEPKDTSSDATASTTARGAKANPVYRDVDASNYESKDQILYPSSPVMLVGDSTILVPGVGNDYDKKAIEFSSSDTAVGEITYEDSAVTRTFFFKAKSQGVTKVELAFPGVTEGPEKRFFNIRCFDEGSATDLSLVPAKDTVVLNDDNKSENVKFTLCGDYSGEVWAFVYYSDAEEYGALDADWLDPTTLSVDIKKSIIEDGEHYVSIVLTPKDDLDTILGCLKYKFTVEK